MDGPKTEAPQSLIDKLYSTFSNGLPFAAPISNLRTTEHELVQGVLQMLQGFSSPLFYWEDSEQRFHVKKGIYVPHLSQTSLIGILSQFVYSATCLHLVESFVKKVEISSVRSPPTLRAFANSVSIWLKRLRSVALKKETVSVGSDTKATLTLLGLANALSSLCFGAEYLLQVVHGAIPSAYFESETVVPAGEMSVHILNHLYKQLDEVCPVRGGEEEAYHMLLVLFVGSLLPYIEGLDSWLYDGTLDDPFEELFFHTNNAIAIDQPAFWEKSYLLRSLQHGKSGPGISLITGDDDSMKNDKRETGDREPVRPSSSGGGKDQNDMDIVVCPLFLKDMARAIVSAGKSLQLMRYVPGDSAEIPDRGNDYEMPVSGTSKCLMSSSRLTADRHPAGVKPEDLSFTDFEDPRSKDDGFFRDESDAYSGEMYHAQGMGGLTLSEVFCVSLTGLIEYGSHVFQYFRQEYPWNPKIAEICKSYMETEKLENEDGEAMPASIGSENIWCKFLVDTILQRSSQADIELVKGDSKGAMKDLDFSVEIKEVVKAVNFVGQKWMIDNNGGIDEMHLAQSFCPENPAITVSRDFLSKNKDSWDELNLSRNFYLPPLNDDNLREAIFGGNDINTNNEISGLPKGIFKGTNSTFGFQFGEYQHLRLEDDIKTTEALFPFPTLLPCFQEDVPVLELLPFQKNSTLASRVLNWVQSFSPKATPLPLVIIQECLLIYIKKQVNYVGRHILSKLMNGWRLMDELIVLRAIYLLGSGDLLQQFLTVLFDKLDKGESWDDDFELNTVLQESIRNSADGMLLSAEDSLVVSILKPHASDDEERTTSNISTPRRGRTHCFGIDALDTLKFTYKVSWPLELIANLEAIKKYNQVMGFLLKVKRAKFVLDKARRWMWKGGGTTRINHKHHLLVEQKLLHFVDAFHQYVMDRVFHSAWLELCKGMASAGSLDEVIEVHEAYLLSIQRQCFVAPDKLWALIASRIKSILGLALDFYSIQQTLCSGGAVPAIKTRCEMEVDRIEKQFDDCISFLLRVLSFKLNVGHFPHLADLVTRINYNYFYMSDNGNLLTIPGSDTTSKLGKAFPSRPDS
ncbi:uncharacterized protein LOC131218651 isoform X2 [Magnolia sinica]|uniref:uncharacterized protein LOC131218651 isoform X2 n=1 Tax=Magnolia sinica TaxID=86752 RepID=UPI0026595402|nr:uncharacterized protein LOC131218651 isoform X2 [Magnolia sinica]